MQKILLKMVRFPRLVGESNAQYFDQSEQVVLAIDHIEMILISPSIYRFQILT